MQTTDKVQTSDSTAGTSTSTSYTYKSSASYQSEKGWECPRCGRINAPWVRQCDCSPSPTSNWDKITVNPCDDWWKTKITCDDTTPGDEWWRKSVDTFRIHPEEMATFTTAHNSTVGGSDYKDSATGAWVNVPKTYTNSVKR